MTAMLTISDTAIGDLKLITPFTAEDDRGIFMKYFEKKIYREQGLSFEPYEEIQSVSKKGVIRGMHFQKHHWQDKIVRVTKGAVFDVAVDLRKNSPTFGKWAGFELTDCNLLALYIPKGFAHGFLALEENTVFCYCCGDQYDPDSDGGFVWNDPKLNINWSQYDISEPIVSVKDSSLPLFSEVVAYL